MVKTVVIADDEKVMKDLLEDMLSSEGYNTYCYSNGNDVINHIENKGMPDVFLLDIRMPHSGIDTAKEIRQKNEDVPIIAITANMHSSLYKDFFQLNFYDVLEKPFNPNSITIRVNNAIESSKIPTYQKMTESLMLTIAKMGDSRDKDTQNHNKRLGEICYVVAKEYGIDKKLSNDLKLSAMLHDIGKISIPDNILQKPEKLNKDEFEIIKTHTSEGASLLSGLVESYQFRYMRLAQDIALYHHEKEDGSGYPIGLTAPEIPNVIKIVTMADIYDAVTMNRPYHNGRSHKEGLEIIKEETQKNKLNKDVLEAFLRVKDKIEELKSLYD